MEFNDSNNFKCMRGLILVSGMIIVIIGIVEYAMLKNYLSACEATLDPENIDLNLLQMCDQIKYVQYGALVMCAMGFIVSIYGAVKKPVQKVSRMYFDR